MAPNDPKQPKAPAAGAGSPSGSPTPPPEEPKAGESATKAPTDVTTMLAQKLVNFLAGKPTNAELEAFIAGELRTLGLADANTKALFEIYKTYLGMHAAYAGKMGEIIAGSTGKNLDEKNKLLNDSLKDLREAWMKQYLDIIKRGIEGKISIHETKIEMAKMGVMFGSLLQGVGILFDKPELVAMGKGFVDRNTKEAEMEADLILNMEKEADRIKKSSPDKWYEKLEQLVRTSFEEELQRNVNKGKTALDPAIAAEIQRRIREAEQGKAAPYSQMNIPNAGLQNPGVTNTDNRSGIARNVRNNNPGNIRDIKTGQFRVFDTPEAGLQAMHDDLMIKITGKSAAMKKAYGKNYSPTLENLINVWAPPNVDGNDTKAYIDRVSKKTGIDPKHVLKPEDLKKLIPAMIWHEGGGEKALSHFQPALDKKFAAADVPAVPGSGDTQVAVLNNPEASAAATAVFDTLMKSLGVKSQNGAKQPYDAVAHIAQAPKETSGDMRGRDRNGRDMSNDGDTAPKERPLPAPAPMVTG